MYTSSNFTSDLINSYAWDTAIYFLQKCDNRDLENNIPYSRQDGQQKRLKTIVRLLLIGGKFLW